MAGIRANPCESVQIRGRNPCESVAGIRRNPPESVTGIRRNPQESVARVRRVAGRGSGWRAGGRARDRPGWRAAGGTGAAGRSGRRATVWAGMGSGRSGWYLLQVLGRLGGSGGRGGRVGRGHANIFMRSRNPSRVQKSIVNTSFFSTIHVYPSQPGPPPPPKPGGGALGAGEGQVGLNKKVWLKK